MKQLCVAAMLLCTAWVCSAQTYKNCDKSDPPEELNRRRVSEPAMRYGSPYTMFNRGDNFNYDSAIQQVRNNILAGVPLRQNDGYRNEYTRLYVEIWQSAAHPEPGTCYEAHYCPHPGWVKNNAIVSAVGLKLFRQGDTIVRFVPFTSLERAEFVDKAFYGIQNLNPSVISCWGGEDCGNVRNKAFDLVQYLQSYDILKAMGQIPNYAGDRNGGNCTPRNKLREFAKNLYVESNNVINSRRGWKKNHGIICASALGMAALVLNDAGVELNYGRFFFGWIVGKGTNWPQPDYSPQNWLKRAVGTPGGYGILSLNGEDGMEDNFFHGDHKINYENVPQSSPDGTSGYAEGPGYFADLSKVFLIYCRTADNMLPSSNDKNYLAQEKYKNILKWYMQMVNHDNSCPTYDNTEPDWGNYLGILGKKEYPSNASYLTVSPTELQVMDLRGDYLLAFGADAGENLLSSTYYNEASGNIVLRNQTTASKQTFHMLCEKDYAVDIAASSFDESHDEPDMGAWSLFAQDLDSSGHITGKNYQVGVDPPYFGWAGRAATNQYFMHNTVQITGPTGLDSFAIEYINPAFAFINGSSEHIQEFNLTFDYHYRPNIGGMYPINQLLDNAVTRNVLAVNTDNDIYYFMNDYVDATDALAFHSARLNINGNGNKNVHDGDPDSMSFRKAGNLYRWTYPCKVQTFNDGWNLTAHVAALKGGISGNTFSENFYTTNQSNYIGSKGYKIADGTHTRLIIDQPVRKTIFQSFLYPQKCDALLPVVTKDDTTTRHVTTTIRFINNIDTSITKSLYKNIPSNPSTSINDSVSHFHFTRWEGNNPDSVFNPFNLPGQSSAKLRLNAQKAFVKQNTLARFQEGYCPPSYCAARYISFLNGSYINFNGVDLIRSDLLVDFTFTFRGRHAYSASIRPLETPSSSDSIEFLLPDVGRAVDMVALESSRGDTMPGRYDSLTNTFHMMIPTVERNFVIEEKQNCLDCYFPPISNPYIDTIFNADDGKRHTLGHKLTIRRDEGAMYVLNSTKINMCDGAYLLNRDSLILEGPCQLNPRKLRTCEGIDSITAFNSNSMIIIPAGSALVLDSGSTTIVKNGAGIYVKQFGSLIIRNNSFVQIGDSGECKKGWGEIIAEPNAYVYIDPSAHIEYRRVIGDTADRNLFVVSMLPVSAISGVYYPMMTTLQNDSVFPDTSYAAHPDDICAWDTINPIRNREWGYSNFSKPYATYQVRNDTLCPGQPLHIYLNRILNDGRYEISVCRMDSIFVPANPKVPGSVSYYLDTCIQDTVVRDTITNDPPTCREPRNTPDEWTYYFAAKTLHRVTITVWNGCDVYDDTIGYIYVADTPRFRLIVPSPACEGIGTVIALVTDSISTPVYYSMEVTEVPDTANLNVTMHNPSKIYSEEFYGYLPDTFDFPGYYFKGGRSYSISLTVMGGCGSYSTYDTLTIPSGVGIVLEKPTAYSEPVNGATSIQLHGYATQYDSIRWEPSTWLNSDTILTPISTPLDSITYVLIAYSGGCVATDTTYIRYKHVANAGYSDSVCYNDNQVLLGNMYDLSIFLGYVYYFNATDFKNNWYYAHTSTDPAYFRYFTHFMMHNNFATLMTGCGGGSDNAYNKFIRNVQKDLFFKESWYINYYNDLMQFSNPDMNVFDNFVSGVTGNSALKNNLDSITNWSELLTCMSDLFMQYDDYLVNHNAEVHVNWDQIVDGDTTAISAWNEYFMHAAQPEKTTVYRVSVITPSYAEIDEITVWVDTVLTPEFHPALAFDSTIYFMNYTEPESSVTTYSWDFGDGDTSTEINPVHTFLAFDSGYVVCLSATNKCGTSMYCDTVWVDSAHWGSTFISQKIPSGNSDLTRSNSREILRQQLQKSIANGELPIALTNYPNPLGNSTTIDYEIWQAFASAELRITNMLGQPVFIQHLQKPKDKIQVDAAALPDGIYYYSLIIDGAIKQTRSMAIIH